MRWIQMFSEGNASQRDLLGGKGANLAEMTRMGLPVPQGFTITTDACRAWSEAGAFPPGLVDELHEAVARLEGLMGTGFGDTGNPLLVSVRSGAKFSMPGMMDTVLNVGLTEAALPGFLTRTGDEWFTWDARRRLLDQFSTVVLDVDHDVVADACASTLAAQGVDDPSGLDVDGLRDVATATQTAVTATTGEPFPDDQWEQLTQAVEAVFRSWNSRRAQTYRALHGIADDLGTAVNVQAMVFGNAGEDSGTGVAFTRNPATGERTPYGDWLMGAQGEDVVAGIRNTEPLAALADVFPACHAQLLTIFDRLEQRYSDMCDVEFTIEHGTLHVLQTRVGKRSARAALDMAVDMVDEGLIDEREAVRRFSTEQLERLLHPQFDTSADYDVLTVGQRASPGAASGHAVFTADEAQARAEAGEEVILVRTQTSPEDLHGLIAAQGVLTSRGGLVSHAAVVARGIGTPAVCGASELKIDEEARCFSVGDVVVHEGDMVSIDGTSGQVVAGFVPAVAPTSPPALERLLGWADEYRELQVWANADTPQDARTALERGAQGIGLCRTEHQFLDDRLPLVRRAILADTEDDEQAALDDLYKLQHDDFLELFEVMDGLPVTVRLLDPPLHEFLPDLTDLLVHQAKGELDEDGERMLDAVYQWEEENPMLGVRGVRLGLLRPALYRMQVQALMDAAVERRRLGGAPIVRIMIPLVVTGQELDAALKEVRGVVDRVVAAADIDVDVHLGTMIETPRAAIIAGRLARRVDFLSFGTNDLTQMVFGFSRDDVEIRVMPLYLQQGLLAEDPFRTIDELGVGGLVRSAVIDARETRPDIDLGVCGEHGGDPASIDFFHRAGLREVSCSPFRLTVARLAAAHAALKTGEAVDV